MGKQRRRKGPRGRGIRCGGPAALAAGDVAVSGWARLWVDENGVGKEGGGKGARQGRGVDHGSGRSGEGEEIGGVGAKRREWKMASALVGGRAAARRCQ